MVTGVRRRRNLVSSGILFTSVHTFIARKRRTVKLLASCGGSPGTGSEFLLDRDLRRFGAQLMSFDCPSSCPNKMGLATGQLTGGHAWTEPRARLPMH
jgi:hypothetical protein